MNRFFLIPALLILAAPGPAAAHSSDDRPAPQVMNMGGASSGVGEVDLGPFGTTERAPPTISKIEFTVIPPAATLQERIDRLLHGLRTPVAHEHDHYGYEIRRYMARIGDQEIFQDTERLQEE